MTWQDCDRGDPHVHLTTIHILNLRLAYAPRFTFSSFLIADRVDTPETRGETVCGIPVVIDDVPWPVEHGCHLGRLLNWAGPSREQVEEWLIREADPMSWIPS
jgi:hypothetical protein